MLIVKRGNFIVGYFSMCLLIPNPGRIQASTICCLENAHIPLDPYLGLWDGFYVWKSCGNRKRSVKSPMNGIDIFGTDRSHTRFCEGLSLERAQEF